MKNDAPSPRQLMHQLKRLSGNVMAQHSLDLSGLTVYTEAATGSYSVTPCLAALAGARVIALAQDSAWGDAREAADYVQRCAEFFGIRNSLEIVFAKLPEDLAQADIITNSGHVRPLDAAVIKSLKSTAVIPMLWETFEWRPYELDLDACKARGILVMGTDENRLEFFPYASEMLIKLLHRAGIAVYHGHFLCLGTGPVMDATCMYMERLGANIVRAAWDYPINSTATCGGKIDIQNEDFLASLDAVICDERTDTRILLGSPGLLSPELLAKANPSCVVINRHGMVSEEELLISGLVCIPSASSAKWQSPHVTSASIGVRPVVELMAAGLAVGAAMSRARLAGLELEESARYALSHSCAQDLLPPYNWLL